MTSSHAESAHPASHHRPRRLGFRRFSVGHFLAALVLLLVITPVVDQFEYRRLIDAILFTLVLCSGVLAVGGRRRTMLAGLLLLAPALVFRWGEHFAPGRLPHPMSTLTFIAFMSFVTFHLLRFILRAARVNSEVISAAVAVYLVLGIIWAVGYLLLARLSPGAFVVSSGAADSTMDVFNAICFSFGSLSTLGFGPVTPVSRLAMMLPLLEAIAGMFYVAILISRLVSLYTSEASEEAQREDARH